MEKFPRPALTIDAVALTWNPKNQLQVLLGKRAEDPFRNKWALPGAFLHEGKESPEETLSRLLLAKAGTPPRNPTLIGVAGKPKRDPRAHVVSIAYLCIIPHPAETPTAGGNFTEAIWHPLQEELPKLAFDHNEILKNATEKLHPIRFSENAVFNLLPREFTIAWAREVCEALAPQDQKHLTEVRNFYATFRKFEKEGIVEPTNQSLQGKHRPAKLYRRTFKPFQ